MFVECKIIDEKNFHFIQGNNQKQEMYNYLFWKKFPEFKQIKSVRGSVNYRT